MASQQSSSLETKAPKTKNPKSDQNPSSSVAESKKRKRGEEEIADEMEEVETESSKALEQEASKYVPILVLDLEWCKSCDYKELLDVFESQKWIKLLSECGVDDVYPRAMTEFCENYGYAKGTITSSVNGVEFSFDEEYLAKLFEVPNEGYDNYFKGKYNLKIGKVGKDEILSELGGVKGVNKIDHNSLSPLGKLMFNVVRRIVFPRTQKRGEANLLDCAVIYCLMFNVQINFPSLMISHLDHTVPSDLKVGYGPFLTTIFKSFNVPLEGYGKVALKKDQFIQQSTLNGLNLGVLDGCTEWYTEILRREEELKKKEEEKSKVRKSRRLLPKVSPSAVPHINLEDEGVKEGEFEVLVPGETGKLEKMMKELAENQLVLEGQLHVMQQNLRSFEAASEKRHNELLALLREPKVPEETPPPKPADTTEDGPKNDKTAAADEKEEEESLISAVPLAQLPPETPFNP